MVRPGRLIRLALPDAIALALGWSGLMCMAHPQLFASRFGDPIRDVDLVFELGVSGAFLCFIYLALRQVRRLIRAGQKVQWDPAVLPTQGTVVAEFALVLPLVLLLMGTVAQIALVANAAVVVRYAAFASARSAMVNFEAETRTDLLESLGGGLHSLVQAPPFPEWVDKRHPEHAAHLVLASISPRLTVPHAQGAWMQNLLEQQSDAWRGGNFAQRVSYAAEATEVRTIRDKYPGVAGYFQAWHDTMPPLIPKSAHAAQPARQRMNSRNTAYLLPAPPPLSSMLNALFAAAVPAWMPLNPSAIDLSVINTAPIDNLINDIRRGAARAIQIFADSPVNVDPFGPKEVEINITYHFKLSIPSLIQLAPGLTEAAPGSTGGRAFVLKHNTFFTARLQSTGGRRSLLGLMPKVPDVKGIMDQGASGSGAFETVDNTPLPFRLR